MNIFRDKVAIVTGAASGIGRALSAELGRRGAQVAAADLNAKGAEETADRVRAAGGRARPQAFDVSDAEAFRKLAEETASDFGRIDYLFNNAGIWISAEAKDLALADWRRVIEVDLWGVIHGIQAVYPIMIRQGAGHIVNTGSAGGLVPLPGMMPYIAAKHAVVGLSTSLRSEAEAYGVRVSVVIPGFVDTGIYSEARYVETDRVKTLRALPRWLMKSPEKCARIVLRGVERNRAIILAGREVRLLWRCFRAFPGLFIRTNRFVSRKMRKLR